MKNTVVLPCLVLFLIGLTLPGCRQPGVESEIARYVEDLVSKDQFAGAVLVAKDGTPILKAAYGLADRSSGVPNRVDTRFNLGSMNKMFTAVAILQLVEEGRLSVDDRIVDHWPGYANQEVANKVTIHHLLTHTSGMGDFFGFEFYRTSKDRIRDVDDYLPLFVDAPLQFEPGERFSYSNAGYVVLGKIIEKVTWQSYLDYVGEHIYRPCHMTNTDAYELDYVVPNLAIGYTRQDAREGSLRVNSYAIPIKGTPAGGGYSTVEDLLQFSTALLNHELLSPESTETLLAGKVDMESSGFRYAYGFVDRTLRPHRIVGHSGGAPGISSNLDIYPDLGYVAVVLSNTDEGGRLVSDFIRATLVR